ncbi:sensor histidine kinase [Pseudactinotalea suaedae]
MPPTPWARFGWLMGAGWLVFLYFPVRSVLEVDAATVWQVLSLAGIVAFAGIYVLGFVHIMRDEPPYGGWLSFAVLIALAAGLSLVIGIEALALSPFVISFAMFAFRWPRGAIVSGLLLVVSLVLLALSGDDDQWFFVILLPLIFGFTMLVRVLGHYGERHERFAREMAVVSERERVARDVHDVLGHSLTAISVKAELASRLIEVDGGRAAQELLQVQTLAREALAEIRLTVSGLRATRIDDELEVARDALTAAGIEAVLPADPDVVEVGNRIVLAWALREATTNVIRHSRARRCVVTLGPATLVVSDDGVGSPGTEGNGLRGLRERVAASGGTLTLGAGPDGHGHELRVEL